MKRKKRLKNSVNLDGLNVEWRENPKVVLKELLREVDRNSIALQGVVDFDGEEIITPVILIPTYTLESVQINKIFNSASKEYHEDKE